MRIEEYLKGLMLVDENAAMFSSSENTKDILNVRDSVAVINIEGILTRDLHYPGYATSMKDIITAVQSVENDNMIKSLIFRINSPGGIAQVVDILGSEIVKCSKRVISVIDGMACSGAYWIASQTDRIIVTPLSQVGSIGAVYYHQIDNESEMIKITSDNAPMKAVEGKTEGEISEIKSRLNAIEDEFITAVALGRNVSKSEVIEKYGKGGIKLGRAALEAGMVDKLVENQDELIMELGMINTENISDSAVKIEELNAKIEELNAEIQRIHSIAEIKADGNESLILEGINDKTKTNTQIMQEIIKTGKSSMEPLVHGGTDHQDNDDQELTGSEAIWAKNSEIRDEFSSKDTFVAYYNQHREEFE